ncbi:thiamine diphosphokinase [Peptoclostridium acidaminophilum DSM 3953]|uniref:Thiamine diphosphokinase n=1 Tax=Peptoclostridium acidaminophilum DSM 3953 TaxID=1286171 RepID=W8T4S0_PEPAC|nr:thiamine diphosphokinase [Peptoclostridium acidaminophilum]AHM56759.1 thiamine diphosphokinase [Peptoclostridium acidaminophilum DSM 3953]
MKAGILVNGTLEDGEFYKVQLSGCDYVISADGASNFAYTAGIVPDVIMGDMDSISSEARAFFESKGVAFEGFPSRKDFTDTELCMEHAKSKGAREIVLYGAIGSRIDHSLANIGLMYLIFKSGIKPGLVNETNEVFLIDSELELSGEKGDLVSVLPIMGDAKGVTLEGLEYPLCNYDIDFGRSIGVSNVMTGKTCRVSLKEGYLLVIKSKD